MTEYTYLNHWKNRAQHDYRDALLRTRVRYPDYWWVADMRERREQAADRRFERHWAPDRYLPYREQFEAEHPPCPEYLWARAKKDEERKRKS